MKILLVGGTGVLSVAVTQQALNQRHEVYMINRGNRMEWIPVGIHLLKADIYDEKKIVALLDNMYFDAIIDFICYNDKQLEYSFNLFKDRTSQYVFISSCAVYNSAICRDCDEDAPKNLPVWQYSIDKNKSEELLVRLAKNSSTHYTIIRPSVTYGNTRIPYGICPPYGYHWTIVERILHDKPIVTWNKGENFCNIMHVEDFSIGVVGLLGNQQAYNEAFNVVGDTTPSWKDVLDILSDLLNKEIKTFDVPSEYYASEIPERRGEIEGGRSLSVTCSNQKLKSVVKGFEQTVSLQKGLKRTLDYYKSHNYIYGIDYAFDADTDRIIAKYAKEKKISVKGLNLHYIDYLNEKKWINFFKYFAARNGNCLLIKVIKRLYRKLAIKK